MGRDGRGVKAASNTSIQISFTYQGVECKERLPLEPTPANLKRAEQHRTAILHAIEQGTFDYATTFPDSPRRLKFARYKGELMSVADYFTGWVEDQKAHLKRSTWVEYDKVVRNMVVPKFGSKALVALTRVEVKEWLKARDVSNKRLKNLQSILRKALTDAVNDEVLKENPLKDWAFTRRETLDSSEVDGIDPFSAEEQSLILAAAEGQFRNLIQFALWTGLRTSELVGLNWDDIDWVRGEVFVRRAVTQKSKSPEVPKTKSSVRRVKLLPSALGALAAQKPHTYLKGEEVFQDPRYGERWSGDYPIREVFWMRVLKKAKVRYRNPYQTRHTFASMMLSAGENPWWVARQMGHASLTMLERNYGRWMPDGDANVGMRAEERFGTPHPSRRMTG